MRLDSEVIPIKERSSMLFLRYGRLDVEDGAFVLIDEKKVRMQIPVGGLACLLLEPGTTVTHAAIALAADCGTLILDRRKWSATLFCRSARGSKS